MSDELFKICADITHSSSAPMYNLHGKRLAACDNCGQFAVLHRGEACGLETYQCAQCMGEVMCQRCGDIAGQCDCEDHDMDDARNDSMRSLP